VKYIFKLKSELVLVLSVFLVQTHMYEEGQTPFYTWNFGNKSSEFGILALQSLNDPAPSKATVGNDLLEKEGGPYLHF
jgi:hypothetical protein